jgi:uncharacterized protein
MGVLGAVERAETALRALGFVDLRVRHYGELACRGPVGGSIGAPPPLRRDRRGAGAGYRYVTLDRGAAVRNLNRRLAGLGPGAIVEAQSFAEEQVNPRGSGTAASVRCSSAWPASSPSA